MKAIKYLLILGAVMLLGASCSKERVPGQQESFTCTFQVNLPESTKSLGDGSKADRLTVRIYDAKDRFMREEQFQRTAGSSGWTVDLSLVTGLGGNDTYKISFFATSSSADCFTIDSNDQRSLAIDYGKLDMNADTEDAFLACCTVQPAASFVKNMVLERIFAQLNLLVSPAQAATSVSSSFSLTGSIPGRVDLLSPQDTGNPVSEINFGATAVPQSESIDGKAVVGSAFVLCPGGNGTAPEITVGVAFTLVNGESSINKTVANVPLSRNKRTNLIVNQ